MAQEQVYERATGILEQVRQCMATGCRKFYRAATAQETTCPHCGSENTRDTREGHEKGTARPRLVT